MNTIVGIDIGGSTTKISGFLGTELLKCIQVEASNPIASLFGAFGQFLTENELDLSDIQDLKDDVREIKKQLKEFKSKKSKDDE